MGFDRVSPSRLSLRAFVSLGENWVAACRVVFYANNNRGRNCHCKTAGFGTGSIWMTCLNAPPATRLKIAVRGAVQGVGFRPFVHRLAVELGLAGWVNNSSQGVFIEAEGPRAGLEQFLLRLRTEKPPRSFIQSLESWWLDAAGYAGFEIRPSETGGGRTAIIMPDLATCPDCLGEIFDPRNRRHLYPFTNCTHCGPRFSIVESLPYDRANTSMKQFALCSECEQEYRDPANRRFHAQPNACPKCGPHLELWDAGGAVLATHHEALLQAAKTVCEGKILALKGIGGFQLMADARNKDAVRRLRERKQREEKPFALMYPSLNAIGADCRVSDAEARLLASPESPIVLLQRTVGRDSVEPSNSLAPQVGRGVSPTQVWQCQDASGSRHRSLRAIRTWA